MITLLLLDVPFLKKLTNKKTCNSSFFPNKWGKGICSKVLFMGELGSAIEPQGCWQETYN